MRIRHFIAALLLIAASATGKGADSPYSLSYGSIVHKDSTAMAALDSKLKEYLAALDHEPRKTKCEEADFIIEACSDSAIRQRTAETVYRHFLDSRIMGDEAVAIHIYDSWFATGKIEMKSEAELWAAKLFATVNRQSLIGCRAPELQLEDLDGNTQAIFESGRHGNGRYSVLFFYDTDCPKCKIESILMRNVLENDSLPVDFYAIYTGRDNTKWREYVNGQLEINATDTNVRHLWDPDGKSGMDIAYGVIQTPRIFIVNPEGIIIGRGLDTYAMEQILSGLLAPAEIEYGSDEAMEMFRTAFSPIEKGMGCEGIAMMADHISDSVLEVHDTLLYKQMLGDLLYFVSSQRGGNYKCGTPMFVDKYILGRNDIWNTADDSLKVVGLATLMKNMAELAPIGKQLPDIKVPATVVTRKGRRHVCTDAAQGQAKKPELASRQMIFRLSAAKDAIVIFHTEGCEICRSEIAAAYSGLESGELSKVILIDMDEMFSAKPETAELLMENFDLSALPFIIATDSRAHLARKYISLQ
ncbi:MAG: peroxiredoxin family protein [Bacteroides sp.]|nr:peroxiredoxin family protein [Bacteroides sp.]